LFLGAENENFTMARFAPMGTFSFATLNLSDPGMVIGEVFFGICVAQVVLTNARIDFGGLFSILYVGIKNDNLGQHFQQ